MKTRVEEYLERKEDIVSLAEEKQEAFRKAVSQYGAKTIDTDTMKQDLETLKKRLLGGKK